MKLHEMDLGTLAAVKAGLTRDEKDGTLLVDDEEETFFFTTRIAPDHYLYVELRTDFVIRISTGVFRRPIEHLRRMVRVEYNGLRIHRDALGIAGEVSDLVDDPTDEDERDYKAGLDECWAQDRAIDAQYGPFADI